MGEKLELTPYIITVTFMKFISKNITCSNLIKKNLVLKSIFVSTWLILFLKPYLQNLLSANLDFLVPHALFNDNCAPLNLLHSNLFFNMLILLSYYQVLIVRDTTLKFVRLHEKYHHILDECNCERFIPRRKSDKST